MEYTYMIHTFENVTPTASKGLPFSNEIVSFSNDISLVVLTESVTFLVVLATRTLGSL